MKTSFNIIERNDGSLLYVTQVNDVANAELIQSLLRNIIRASDHAIVLPPDATIEYIAYKK